MKVTKEDWQVLKILLIALGGIIGFLCVMVMQMSIGVLRAWAILSPFVIGLVFLAGWRLGTRDSRAHISGLDKGIDAMAGAAAQVADLRVSTTERVRNVIHPDQAPPPALPRPRVEHVRQLGDGDIIDL